MLDFRKVLLALSVAGLGLVGTASAQTPLINCGAAVPASTPIISVEGVTELLPTITFACAPGGTIPNSATLVLTSDVPFTAATNSTTGLLDVSAVASGTGLSTAASTASLAQSGSTITATFNLTGATGFTGITFTGIRVNASAAPATSSITITPSGIAGGGIVDTAAAANVAFVSISLVTSVLNGGAPVSLCSASASIPAAVTSVTVAENFAGALKTAATITGPSTVTASQGTRIAVTFNNLNTGVSYYVPSSVSGGGLALTAFPAATGTTASTAVTAGSGSNKVASQILLTPTNGSATIYYGVTAGDSGAPGTVIIPLIETIPSASAVTSVSTSPVSVSVYLVGAASGYPQYVPVSSPTVVNQSAAQSATSNSLLTACSTTLLFPYITNLAGFDTGIAIANASTGVVGISPTSGSCVLSFYGQSAPATAYNTGNIASGTDFTTALSSIAPGFQGYAVAVCNFSGAHADAFLGQFGAGGSLSGNYLAIVVNQNGATAAPFVPSLVAF